MAKRCCWNCVYGKRPQDRWLRIALRDWPAMMICSVCANCPGRTCGVYAGGYCRNFCPKPGVACDPPEPPIEPGEKICKIPLSQGLFALVDPEDYEELSKYKWSAFHACHCYYAVRRGRNNESIYMHRVIMKTPAGMMVDHINQNGLDNRKKYLRNCTGTQNTHNSRPRCVPTGFKGVKYNELTGKYEATIWINRRKTKIGEFDDPVAAAKARDRVAREVQGEYAYLNFPDDFAQEAGTGDAQQGDSPAANAGREAMCRQRARRRYVNLSGTAILHTSAGGTLSAVRSELRPAAPIRIPSGSNRPIRERPRSCFPRDA